MGLPHLKGAAEFLSGAEPARGVGVPKLPFPALIFEGQLKNPPRTGDKRRALPYPRPGRAKAPSGAFERLRSLFLDFHC